MSVASFTAVKLQELALSMMYDDIMERGSKHITDDFENLGYAIIIFRMRVVMPKFQVIVVDTHIANSAKDRAIFKTESGKNHLLQSLPESARKRIYDNIMEKGSRHITDDLGIITFFCELYPDGKLTNSFTTISNETTKQSEQIEIEFAKSK